MKSVTGVRGRVAGVGGYPEVRDLGVRGNLVLEVIVKSVAWGFAIGIPGLPHNGVVPVISPFARAGVAYADSEAFIGGVYAVSGGHRRRSTIDFLEAISSRGVHARKTID